MLKSILITTVLYAIEDKPPRRKHALIWNRKLYIGGIKMAKTKKFTDGGYLVEIREDGEWETSCWETIIEVNDIVKGEEKSIVIFRDGDGTRTFEDFPMKRIVDGMIWIAADSAIHVSDLIHVFNEGRDFGQIESLKLLVE